MAQSSASRKLSEDKFQKKKRKQKSIIIQSYSDKLSQDHVTSFKRAIVQKLFQ